MRPFIEVYLNRASHLSFFNKYMLEQKQYVNHELTILSEQFTSILEKIKEIAHSELDSVEKNLVENYEQVTNLF